MELEKSLSPTTSPTGARPRRPAIPNLQRSLENTLSGRSSPRFLENRLPIHGRFPPSHLAGEDGELAFGSETIPNLNQRVAAEIALHLGMKWQEVVVLNLARKTN